jgi:glutamine cyclotransferase
MKGSVFFILSLVLLSSCVNNEKSNDSQNQNNVKYINYYLVNKLPHDSTSFTEGLFFHGSNLFESTGATADLPQTKSIFGIVDQKTGKINVKAELNKDIYFGEGIVLVSDKIFQLTYKNQLCFVYDSRTYKKTGQYKFSNLEGWGLTTNGKDIIMSDGTSNLTYRDPGDFEIIKTIPVTENGYVVNNLNELEFINGFIYANIWLTNSIVKIDPTSGQVVGKLDLTKIYQQEIITNPNAGEMNGIAYNPANSNLYITGKLWSNIYQISLSN